MIPNSPWNDKKTNELKELLSSGCGYTCKELGFLLGVSRNQVIGKVHRMGWSSYLQSNRNNRAAVQANKKKRHDQKVIAISDWRVNLPKEAPTPALDASGMPYTIANVGNRMCRYPYHDPHSPKFHLCGAPTMGPLSYWCAYHRSKLYQKANGAADQD